MELSQAAALADEYAPTRAREGARDSCGANGPTSSRRRRAIATTASARVAYRAIAQFRFRPEARAAAPRARGREPCRPRLGADRARGALARAPGDVNAYRPLLHELAARDPNVAVRRLAIVCFKNGTAGPRDDPDPRRHRRRRRDATPRCGRRRDRSRSCSSRSRNTEVGAWPQPTPLVGLIMGSRSDWETMRHCRRDARRARGAVRAASRLGPPDAGPAVRVRGLGRGARAAGADRGGRRGRASPRDGGGEDAAAGARRPGRVEGARRASTRCSRSCRCPPASRSGRSRSGAPARSTPRCSRRRSWRAADAGIRERLARVPRRADASRCSTLPTRRRDAVGGDARRVHRRRSARPHARARGHPARAPLPVPRSVRRRRLRADVGELVVGALRRPRGARPPRGGCRRRHVRVRERRRRGRACASGALPPPRALELGQDRLVEKQLFERLGIPTARFGSLAETGLPALVKARRLGYDGKGQRTGRRGGGRSAGDELAEADRRLRARALDRRRPWHATARRASGRWPRTCTETASCASRAPRPSDAPQAAGRGARADACSTSSATSACSRSSCSRSSGRLLANEFAPRVHNTGHWTIDGAATSQFENHLRAILGLPLGATAATSAIGDGQPDRRARRRSSGCSSCPAPTSTSTGKSRVAGGSSAT